MINDLLKIYGLSIDILESLSYESEIGVSLKNDLQCFDKKEIIEEIGNYIRKLDESRILPNISTDYRIKSIDSAILKYDRYFPSHQYRKVFNDILGFRAFCDNYRDILNYKVERFRLADMSNGKSNDDGYRGVHLYFQSNPRCYPIEIQFNTFYDRQINDWLHKYIYKHGFSDDIGVCMRNRYESGLIRKEDDFVEELKKCVI